jgi:hypothetical protein
MFAMVEECEDEGGYMRPRDTESIYTLADFGVSTTAASFGSADTDDPSVFRDTSKAQIQPLLLRVYKHDRSSSILILTIGPPPVEFLPEEKTAEAALDTIPGTTAVSKDACDV